MKVVYWSSTIITSIYLLWSSYGYLLNSSVKDGIKDLGFPDFFRVELAVLKIIASVIIVIPQTSIQIKSLAYAGIGFFYLTAVIAHFVHKDPFIINFINLILLAVLGISYVLMLKLS